MKKFYVLTIRDAAEAFVKALLDAGYVQVASILESDFILADKEPTALHHRERFIRNIGKRPIFFYPHTPYSYWLWDRWLEPMPVACNFVVGQGAIDGMKAYGYPNRVEAVGFSRCEVKPFKKTTGKNLLYMSARSMNWKKQDGDKRAHFKTLDWIVNHREAFDSVTVNYSTSIEAGCLQDYLDYGFKFVNIGDAKQLSAKTAQDAFEGIDLIFGCNTGGYVALASGMPTILFNNYPDAPQNSGTGMGHSWDLYKSHYQFPLSLASMSVEDVLALRDAPNKAVESWKKINIGESFNADKFISVVREFI